MSLNIPDLMQVSITLPRDANGMMGRECPECELVFNIKSGTGLKGEGLPCHCAYLQTTNDRAAVVGRKIQISPDEVKRLCAVMRQLGMKLVGQLLAPQNS